MDGFWRDLIVSALVGLVLPGVLLNGAVFLSEREAVPENLPAETAVREAAPVRVRRGTQVREEAREEYLVGAVLGEMPGDFEMEALKAQAVAARTYAEKALVTGGKHGDGSVCLRSECCQAYLSAEDYLARGGDPEGLERIRRAVDETEGCVLRYEGELIEATYFSCSGGMTEDALAVWGSDYPYLVRVESPGEEDGPHYSDTVQYSLAAMAGLLGVPKDGPMEPKNITYTAGGGVDSLEIGGKRFSGTEVRSLLGLRSTAFSLEIRGNTAVITTKGYGHRVGMSQYGADAMARAGKDWRQILAHYYPGTEITRE